MKKVLLSALSLTLLGGIALMPASASTMPKAEADRSSISIGLGPSISFDANVAPHMLLGASVGLPFLVSGSNFGRYDVRLTYEFLQQGAFSLAGIFGIWGNVNFVTPSVSRYIGLELGVGLAYRFTPQLTGRLNIVPGFSFPFGTGFTDFYPPAGGFELAYRFNPSFEGTIGYNGQGDIIGLRFLL
jgi:hypothetical protein